jgi:hypothetical protein
MTPESKAKVEEKMASLYRAKYRLTLGLLKRLWTIIGGAGQAMVTEYEPELAEEIREAIRS